MFLKVFSGLSSFERYTWLYLQDFHHPTANARLLLMRYFFQQRFSSISPGTIFMYICHLCSVSVEVWLLSIYELWKFRAHWPFYDAHDSLTGRIVRETINKLPSIFTLLDLHPPTTDHQMRTRRSSVNTIQDRNQPTHRHSKSLSAAKYFEEKFWFQRIRNIFANFINWGRKNSKLVSLFFFFQKVGSCDEAYFWMNGFVNKKIMLYVG